MNLHSGRAQRRLSAIADFGLGNHADDRFWARPTDIAGVGFLVGFEIEDDHMIVEIRVRGLKFYLDSNQVAHFGDLYNLKDITLGARIAFSGNVRSITEHGVRLGRLHVRQSNAPIEKAVLKPIRDEKGRKILFGEVCIPDPDPEQPSFILFRDTEKGQVTLGGEEDR